MQTTEDPGALRSMEYVQERLGGLSRTSLYKTLQNFNVRLVKLGGRSLVPDAEINRVIAEAMNAPPSDTARERARVAAARSVAVRRRGGRGAA